MLFNGEVNNNNADIIPERLTMFGKFSVASDAAMSSF